MAGVLQTQYTFDPFGATSASGATSSNSFQFAARENDADDFYYYRARYYNPTLARFVSEDPVGFQAGPNLYTYVLDSPVNYVDPFGLDVTICLYVDSVFGVGHVGFGVTPETRTTGFYSATGWPSGAGAIRPDQGNRLCKKIDSSPEKDECMRNCRARRQANPGRYQYSGRNCTDFVRGCLAECGLPGGSYTDYLPRPFFDGLPSPWKEAIR
jgi:RHS repeat-associated protein